MLDRIIILKNGMVSGKHNDFAFMNNYSKPIVLLQSTNLLKDSCNKVQSRLKPDGIILRRLETKVNYNRLIGTKC